ncbi:MAG: hypothetical protein RL514_4797, partial [Verrucomicrobiota bacterium]
MACVDVLPTNADTLTNLLDFLWTEPELSDDAVSKFGHIALVILGLDHERGERPRWNDSKPGRPTAHAPAHWSAFVLFPTPVGPATSMPAPRQRNRCLSNSLGSSLPRRTSSPSCFATGAKRSLAGFSSCDCTSPDCASESSPFGPVWGGALQCASIEMSSNCHTLATTVSMTRSENSDENEACGAYGARPQAGFARVAEGRLLAKNTAL